MNVKRFNLTWNCLALGILSVGYWGCGQSTEGGASTSTGGATGGTVSSGTGGNSTSAGGTSSKGGSAATGGSTPSGGTVATGGSKSTESAPSSGGATAPGSGGNPTGGTSAVGATTGGRASTGGSVSRGGTSGIGTSSAATTGGTVGKGGSETGGSATGGVGKGGNGAGGSTASVGGSGTGASTVTSGGSGTGGGNATCPSPALKAGDSNKTLTVGGISREYILHVPSAYTGSAAVPLVLDFHPIGGSASAWRTGSPYPAVIDKEGVISVFPNGKTGPMGNAWNVKGCCVSQVNGADVDDVAFAKAIVAEVEKTACIDPKRVYAVGFSMGGGMSNYLACHAADVFAAVGPAAFDLTEQNEPSCNPARPITVIEWRGKNDNVVPYAGGHSALVSGMAIDFLGAVGTFQKWASKDGCTGSASAADSNGCQTYSQCSAGVQVTLCTASSGGHEAAKAGVVWPLLKKYTLP